MTLVSQIITDAYRQGNLIAKGAEPTATEVAEGLRYLSRIVKSVFGNEAGEDLLPYPIGRANIARPAGYPWYNTVPDGDWFVPKNIRLMLNLDEDLSVYLHPDPNDGSRFGITDVSNNLSANNLTIFGNGRNVDGSPSIVLNTDGDIGEWFYREDLGNWTRYSPLVTTEEFPFPEEFDDYFITMLAIRLNPSYGTQLDPQSSAVLGRSKRQLKARYRQTDRTPTELALLRLTRMGGDRDRVAFLHDPNTSFDTGWPF